MFNEIDIFMNYLDIEKNRSQMTQISYNRDLIQFHEFLTEQSNNDVDCDYDIDIEIRNNDVDVQSIKKTDITGFIEYLYDSGLKRVSIERKIAVLKSFFKFLYNRNIIKKNPAGSIGYPRKGSKLPKFLSIKEIDLITGFKTEDFIDYRDRALLMTFYSTGARVSEIAGADLSNFNRENKRLKVYGKGSKERIVFITDETAAALVEYLKVRERKFKSITEPLFINFRGKRITARGIFGIVEKRVKDAGLLERVSPHTLRHSFAT